MSIKLREFLNGGLVTARHPTLLRPGELQAADDTILRPGDPAIYKAPGRAVYGTVAATSIPNSVTNGTTTLTTGSAVATAITVDALVLGSTTITSSAAFGSVAEGQSVYGTGIPSKTYVRRVVTTSAIEISQPITAAGATTIRVSNYHYGTYISGGGVTNGTYITDITGASTVIMSATVPANTLTISLNEEVQGLRALSFGAGASDILLAKAADKLYSSVLSTITGTFASLRVGMSHNAEALLETINVKERYVALTGYDLPRIIYYNDSGSGGAQAITERALGMKAVSDGAFVGPTPIAGTWPSDVNFDAGWYWFLITEVAIFSNVDEVEGTYEGTPKKVNLIAPATQGIRVTYTAAGNQPVNDGLYGRNTATHWRVYMSPRQESETDEPVLSSFVRVAEVPIATAFVNLNNTNPYHAGYAAALDSVAGTQALFPGGSTNALSQVTTQARASALTVDSNIVTSVALFGTVTEGMPVFSPNNNLPAGAIVSGKDSSSSIYVTPAATASSSETLTFGNKSSFDNQTALCPINTSGAYRAGFFRNFALADTIGDFSGATITGVKVEIQGKFSTDGVFDPGFNVTLYQGGQAGVASTTKVGRFTTARRLRSGGAEGGGTIILGGPTDTWGVSWVSTNFADGAASFGVLLKKLHAQTGGVNPTTVLDHQIDGVKVTVYAGTNSITLNGDPFRTVTITDQLGTSVDIPAAGAPPIASTGDIFNGILLLNDTSRESDLVGSLPDEEEQFPSVYRIPIQSKDNDKVRVIRRLGNICVIGCLNSVKRLNYFPLETDPDFNQGRCYEDIATDHGMVGPRAAVLMDLPGRGTVLAYLSYKGLYWTDGITCTPLNSDLDWPALVEPTLIQRSVLEIYPRLHLLALYYVPYGGVRKTKAMYFSYHPLHVKEGYQLPATGPITVEGASACSTAIAGVSYLFTGNSRTGKVYLEDSGLLDEDSNQTLPIIRTRRFFTAGDIGLSGKVERVFLVVDAAGNTTTGGFTLDLYRQNQAEAVTLDNTVTGDTATGGVIELRPEAQAELFDFKISKSSTGAATFRLHYIGYEASPYGMDTNN